MKLHLCLAIAFLIGSVAAQQWPIEYVGHKDIYPITSKLGGVYNYYRTYQPAIKVVHGCVPFPAVNRYKAGGGLRLGGARNGECSSSPGQTYARHKDYPGKKVHGIMYAYYFPKDQALAGAGGKSIGGHRHDWEEVVVWVSWDWKRRLGASMSGHGGYTASTEDWNGSHKSVLYANGNVGPFGVKNHEFRTSGSSEGGFEHPIANWYQVTPAIRDTLTNAQWPDENGEEKASPKVIDKKDDGKTPRFEVKMKQAFDTFFA